MPSYRHPPAMHALNEALAFLLELAMLVALGAWGAKAGCSFVSSLLLAVGIPLTTAFAWGMFAAPKARVALPAAGVVTFKVLAFGSGAAALHALDRHGLTEAFALVSFVNTAIAAVDRGAAVHRGHRE